MKSNEPLRRSKQLILSFFLHLRQVSYMLMFLKVSVSLTIECNRSTEVHRDRAILNTCTVCFSCDV